MEIYSALSQQANALRALEDCVRKVRERRQDAPDLALLFPSVHHARYLDRLPSSLSKWLKPRAMAGCSGVGVIGDGREVESGPALSLLCAWLPGVDVSTFRLDGARMPGPDEAPGAWRRWLGLGAGAGEAGLILLCDPYSIDSEDVLRGLDYAFPSSVKLGGLASGAVGPGGNTIYIDGESFHQGAVGLALSGDIVIDPIVAQGCRPIGDPFQITSCEKNLVLELDNRPVLVVLQDLLEGLIEADRRLSRTSLFVGLLGDATKAASSKKDYLIRNILGVDPERGSLAIGAFPRPGQTIQFHLQDRHTSARDLDERLAAYARQPRKGAPAGALLFSCQGRGERLYGKPDHDSSLMRKRLGALPEAGFFCGGEIGPVDGSSFVHGYTSCFGIIRPK